MTPATECARCGQVLSPEDSIDRNGGRVVHLACRRPHPLSFYERALLY
jgi:hypothetical protein